jgi:tRNA U38,U39,U40 pseudouridine synthase TruA
MDRTLEMDGYMKQLASGEHVEIDASQFTPDQIRCIESATVHMNSGTLTVKNSSGMTKDEKAEATPTPGVWNKKQVLPRIRFV